MVELFKELRHIKPQALHFYRLYMFFSFETSAPGFAEIMLYWNYLLIYDALSDIDPDIQSAINSDILFEKTLTFYLA